LGEIILMTAREGVPSIFFDQLLTERSKIRRNLKSFLLSLWLGSLRIRYLRPSMNIPPVDAYDLQGGLNIR
jgi:hypothetical protein